MCAEDPVHPILLEELAGLRAVLERLRALRAQEAELEAASRDDGALVRDLERLREMLVAREDTKDVAALSDQWHRQSSILRQLRRGRPARRVDLDSPYFAHLSLLEEGERRELYLGRATCLEDGLRIIDWRDAPISKVFYRYGQGEEYEEEIAGRRRNGQVLARRMLAVRSQELERVQAPEGDFVRDALARNRWHRSDPRRARLRGAEPSDGDRSLSAGAGSARRLASASLQRAASLGASASEADKRLSEITGLIDPEQFDLITRPQGFLVIRGAAGSGKTTVALHRVAYLAFADPQIDSPETLVVMFSEALRRYVSHVLPSLGIDQVDVRSFGAWVRAQRQRHFRGLPTRLRDDTPGFVSRWKLSPVLEQALRAHVRATPGARTWQQAAHDWATVLTHRSLLDRSLPEDGAGASLRVQLAEFVRWNARLVDPVLAFLEGESDSDAERVELDPEDDALLLRAYQLRVGGLMGKRRRRLRYRHLVVDEAQDFSPVEMQVLLSCMADEASISLAGDTQQHISEEGGFASWREFFDHLGIAGAEVEMLRVSYRATHEVMRFAWAVLGSLREEEEPPETVRHGPPVELFQFQDVGACVAFLGDALRELQEREPLASVAILAPSSASADLYHGALTRSDLRRLRRIRNGDFPFAPGIEVVEIEQSKGLEFDYVILVDVSSTAYPDQAQPRRKLHVGATRAVHQLWLTCVTCLSPIVRGLESELLYSDPA